MIQGTVSIYSHEATKLLFSDNLLLALSPQKSVFHPFLPLKKVSNSEKMENCRVINDAVMIANMRNIE